MKQDIYQKETDKIIADLEQGELTWLKPWSAANTEGRIIKPLRHNGMPYSGINVLVLWGAAMEGGYIFPFWMTFKQAKEFGAHVRKGERGNLVVYANTITKTEEQDDGSAEERIEHAEEFFAATRADIRSGGNRAYYSGGSDHVQMPHFESFRSPEAYYATLAHELTHWTKHEKRLDREFGRKSWGDEGYAREELVAELGAAFLCADLALTPEPGTDHAAYIQSWLNVLKNDKRAIFSAAAHAQKAADFLHGFQQQPQQQEGVAA
ncbi:ArdC family protein [Pseudogemmobacter sp. W21_MBD1_M6]|uniref:ArdC family protein n=1 Tax=Pseudogemmobacter sp. W21_MBD1_M6 TaxID=3240271 RepID=UPI003F9637A7